MKTNIFLLIGFLFIFSFCGTRKQLLTTSPDLPRSTERLYSYVIKRNNDFQSLSIRNIRINFSTPDNTTRLYGSLKMIPDSAILVSLRTPLGVEVSRLLYTEDSVTMLDRRNKRAYFTDYKNLAEIAPLDFNFRLLQALFTGNVPDKYRNTRMPEPEFVRDTLRNEVYLGTFNAPSGKNYMNFYGWIYKDLAKPSYLVFYKNSDSGKFNVDYQDYQKIEEQIFPEQVKVMFDQYNQAHELSLKLNGISLNEYSDVQIDVPSSYKTIFR